MGRLASTFAALTHAFAEGFTSAPAPEHSRTIVTILPQSGGYGRLENAIDLAPSSIYSTTTWPHVAVMRVMKSLARLPLRVHIGDPEGDNDLVPDSHPALKLIRNPNAEDSEYDFKVDIALYLGINGEAPVALDGVGAGMRPTTMRVLDPESLSTPGDYAPSSPWVYNEESGAQTPYITPDSLIMIKERNPKTRRRGLSPYLAAWDAIIQDKLANKYQKRALGSGSAVGYTLDTDDKTVILGEPQRKELRADFQSQMYSENKVYIPGRGMKLRELGRTNREMEYGSLQKSFRDQELAVEGVPPIHAGIVENANRSNSDVQDLIFWRNTMIPMCQMIENALNSEGSGLMWRFGNGIWCRFDLTGVEAMQEDPDAKVTRIVSLTMAGIFSPNRALEALEMEPEVGNPAMDLHYIGAIPIDGTTDTQAAEVVRLRRNPPKRAKNFWSDREQRDQAERLFDSTRAMLEHGWRRTLRDHIDEQAARFLAPLKSMPDGAQAPDADSYMRRFSKTHEEQLMVDSVGKDVRATTVAGIGWGNKMIRRARKRSAGNENGFRQLTENDFDLDHDVVDFIMNLEQKLARQVTETTWDGIKGTIQRSVNDGDTVVQTTERLQEYFDGRRTYAELQRIARTEVTKASNGGTLMAFEKSGVVERKQWVSARDEATRDDHYRTDAETASDPIPLDEDFKVGTDTLAYPGDPAGPAGQVINCRCTVVPVVEGEEL